MENPDRQVLDKEIAHRRKVIKLAQKRIRKATQLITRASAEIAALETRRGSLCRNQ